jgi:hypothetical protein
MAFAGVDIGGNWYGMMVHRPSRGLVHVSFVEEHGSLTGKWDFTTATGGPAKTGAFEATRFLNWLHIRITTSPLANVQFHLTILEHKGESMIFGVIPLEQDALPFATVTLFRRKLPMNEIKGICPAVEFSSKGIKR